MQAIRSNSMSAFCYSVLCLDKSNQDLKVLSTKLSLPVTLPPPPPFPPPPPAPSPPLPPPPYPPPPLLFPLFFLLLLASTVSHPILTDWDTIDDGLMFKQCAKDRVVDSADPLQQYVHSDEETEVHEMLAQFSPKQRRRILK